MTIGIYCIENLVNGKKYIGKSTGIEVRIRKHKHYCTKQEANNNANRYLRNSVQKHGWCNFKWFVLESFEEVDELLIAEREMHWITHFNTLNREFGYNLLSSTNSKLVHSQESRDRMSAARVGIIFSDEWRKKISDGHKGDKNWSFGKRGEQSTWFGKTHTEEAKAKTAEGKSKWSYERYSLDDELLQTYLRMTDVVADGYPSSGVTQVCNKIQKSHYGFHWKKIPKLTLDETQHPM